MGEARRRADQAVDKHRTTPSPKGREEAREGISSASYSAVAESGHTVSAEDAVMPIVIKSSSGKELSAIGTGFFVGPNLIITAGHIFGRENPARLACLQIMDVRGEYYFRPFRQVVRHPVSDIAICELHPLYSVKHNVELLNYVLPIGGPIPRLGAKLTTYAFPDVSVERIKGMLCMGIFGHHYDGVVKEVFPLRRDTVMMNFPCMQTSLHLHGGASGGPVINMETGVVVGVNTTSFSGASNESYVALIHPILDFPIYKTNYVGNVSSGITLRQLAFCGAARVSPENSLVRDKLAPATDR